MFGIGHWELLILGIICFGGFVSLGVLLVAVLAASGKQTSHPNLMACHNCQTLVPTGSAFCLKCGIKLG